MLILPISVNSGNKFIGMKIGIIIPDRNDRPEFLANCLRMIKAQTLQPEIIELVNFEGDGTRNEKGELVPDITKRYRIGYEKLRGKGLDFIAFIENDDWYSPNYLEQMANYWNTCNEPKIMGTSYTYYYSLRKHMYFMFDHGDRASAMNTLIKPDMEIEWCADDVAYTDMHLWSTIKGFLFRPDPVISVGIKHGVGLCGGKGHITRLHRYTQGDIEWLRSLLDPESFSFYTSLTLPG